MRIIHVVPAISEEASGPSYTVVRLCESLIEQGYYVTLATLDWRPGVFYPKFVRSFPLELGPRRLGRSPAMARWLIEQTKTGAVNILHNHGLWMMPNVYPGRVRRAGKVLLVISPRGTVSEWAWNHHRGRKWMMWHLLGQGREMHAADAFHATSEDEYADLRRLGFRQPVCVLPNGIDVPPLVAKPTGERRTLLFLGRIHKKKGIDLLLRAWSAIEPRFPDWDLVVAGPDDGGYLGQYRLLALELKLERVSFAGPVYGQEKLDLYRAAHLYVLPTHSDNYAMTVAEALAAGTPAVVTRGAPWAGLVEHGAGWWIEIGVEPLVAALEEALSLSDARLAEMGRRGREWMVRDYSWDGIARQMAAFYDWLHAEGQAPACVRMD